MLACICYLQISEYYAITRVLHPGPLLNKCGGLQLADICHSMGMTSCQYFSLCVQACDPELTVLLYNEDGELVHLPLVSSGLAELE